MQPGQAFAGAYILGAAIELAVARVSSLEESVTYLLEQVEERRISPQQLGDEHDPGDLAHHGGAFGITDASDDVCRILTLPGVGTDPMRMRPVAKEAPPRAVARDSRVDS
jgi:hypothetical protein